MRDATSAVGLSGTHLMCDASLLYILLCVPAPASEAPTMSHVSVSRIHPHLMCCSEHT